MKGTAAYFGFDDLSENELNTLIDYILNSGKRFYTYGGEFIVVKTFRRLDMYVYCKINEEKHAIEIERIQFHCASLDTWDMEILSHGKSEQPSYNCREVLVTRKDTEKENMAYVNLINADVLPSLVPGSLIRAQVVAYPYMIQYYENEEAYEKLIPENKEGKKVYAAVGAVLPIGFLNNHQLDKDGNKIDREQFEEDLMVITGKVSKVYKEEIKIEKDREFYHVELETNQGKIQVVHTAEFIDDNEIELIKEGSFVSGMFWIEADPAIDKYEGYVLDKDENLMLLQHTFEYGESDRLKTALSDNAVFKTVSSDKEYDGPDEICERFQFVHDTIKAKVYPQLMQIVEVEDEFADKYPVGTTLIALAYNEPDNFETLAFIEMDDDNLIKTIEITNEIECNFKVYQPKLPVELQDTKKTED